MKNLSKLFFIAAFLIVASFGMAQDEDAPSIKTSINKKRIFIGDRIRYKVEMDSRHDLDIDFPQFKDLKIGDCEIKDSGRLVKKSLFGKRTYTDWLDVTSYYVGKRSVPAIEIKYREKGEGNWKKLKTEEMTFKVETVLPSGDKLKDVKDIKGILYPFSPLKFVMLLIALAAALWLLYALIARIFFRRPPPKLPHEIALEELEAARTEHSTGGNIKDYYVRISDAVRRYIEAVFNLKAPEMTTQEFLASLGGSKKFSSEYKALLKTFMEACDLVKFAKYMPARIDIEAVFDTAKKFIEETKEVYISSHQK